MQGKRLTMKEIENSFGSNICRCTGYRPILETFKSYATDAPEHHLKGIHDIEVSGEQLCHHNVISEGLCRLN